MSTSPHSLNPKGQQSGGGLVLRVSILFLVTTVLRGSDTHHTVISQPEEIESNQVERICYLVLVGSIHGGNCEIDEVHGWCRPCRASWSSQSQGWAPAMV